MQRNHHHWTFPELEDSLYQIISTYKNPDELKKKLFYLSKFLNKDVLKLLCIMLHKITFVFANDAEYALEFTNNKHQIEKNFAKYKGNPNHSLWGFRTSNLIHMKQCIVNNMSFKKLCFIGIQINNTFDISNMKISFETLDETVDFDLQNPFIQFDDSAIYKLKNVPFYIEPSKHYTKYKIESPYSKEYIQSNIRSCHLNMPITQKVKIYKSCNLMDYFSIGISFINDEDYDCKYDLQDNEYVLVAYKTKKKITL